MNAKIKYDVLIIGGGLSGLTAGSLLSKSNLKVAVVDKNYNPGGTCGVFKRGSRTFDQGSAMLYGFGERGYNSHRFLFNCLEEPIDVIKHDLLYVVNFAGKRIRFWPSIDKFIEELSMAFPDEKEGIQKFYQDLSILYEHVMVETPSYTTPDEINKKEAFISMLKHPFSYIKFLSYLNKSAKSLLKKYFHYEEIFNFFDKLTSTYCYATVEEAPAILASVMFVDNHVGGSYYPAGSTLFLPGKLEKVIEENDGDMYLEKEVVKILFDNNKPTGVILNDGSEIFADHLIYSGTVWNLYEKLIDPQYTNVKERRWAKNLIPTYPSVVLYAAVDKNVIPEDTAPIEMLIANPKRIDEAEVTAYILSIDDQTLCNEDEHVIVAIGPSFEKWDDLSKKDYLVKKQNEKLRLISVLDKRFSGLSNAVRYAEVATPKTIERYTMKNNGSVAGPKQMLGQHLFKRLHIRTKWNNLFCCGESTTMGTGTPTVTVSGIAAGNAVLKRYRKKPYVYKKGMKNYVRYLEKPVTKDKLFTDYSLKTKEIMHEANRCQFCEKPYCDKAGMADIRGIMRRVSVGNFIGAKKVYHNTLLEVEKISDYEHHCIRNLQENKPVEIKQVIEFLDSL